MFNTNLVRLVKYRRDFALHQVRHDTHLPNICRRFKQCPEEIRRSLHCCRPRRHRDRFRDLPWLICSPQQLQCSREVVPRAVQLREAPHDFKLPGPVLMALHNRRAARGEVQLDERIHPIVQVVVSALDRVGNKRALALLGPHRRSKAALTLVRGRKPWVSAVRRVVLQNSSV